MKHSRSDRIGVDGAHICKLAWANSLTFMTIPLKFSPEPAPSYLLTKIIIEIHSRVLKSYQQSKLLNLIKSPLGEVSTDFRQLFLARFNVPVEMELISLQFTFFTSPRIRWRRFKSSSWCCERVSGAIDIPSSDCSWIASTRRRSRRTRRGTSRDACWSSGHVSASSPTSKLQLEGAIRHRVVILTELLHA